MVLCKGRFFDIEELRLTTWSAFFISNSVKSEGLLSECRVNISLNFPPRDRSNKAKIISLLRCVWITSLLPEYTSFNKLSKLIFGASIPYPKTSATENLFNTGIIFSTLLVTPVLCEWKWVWTIISLFLSGKGIDLKKRITENVECFDCLGIEKIYLTTPFAGWGTPLPEG